MINFKGQLCHARSLTLVKYGRGPDHGIIQVICQTGGYHCQWDEEIQV